MSDATDQLRAAVDHVDASRDALEYGGLDVSGDYADEYQALVGKCDEVLADMSSELKQIALLIEASEMGEDDE